MWVARARWHDRGFGVFWAARTISLLGDQITLLALPLTAAVWLGATPAQMGLLTATAMLPTPLLGLFAGAWVDRRARRPLLIVADLPRTQHAHEFVGAAHGVPVSLILVEAPPGAGPALHRHPYAEVFVVERGQATIHVDETAVVAEGGQIVIAPPNSWHGFTNTGDQELRLTAIHTAATFDTQWAAQPDQAWSSPPAS